ncbi:SDR family oxidoreductase [Pseudomonas gregormendelii]|uniref:SDR family oxidoreductase n=1 Tax=Pseudomonas gregormendelii TaxID=1628277 RepID=A0ABS3AN70_9PSED|nr:SDR family oxidoreductase [Pseudomonas gregormendelii]MBN3968615.1 SDR family oxidoreductase [Pseudomonas gregormendelii]
MGKILITGATGKLGGAVVRSLMHKVPASDVVALVRDASKAQWLSELGVEVRLGDYTDHDSLVTAFAGVEKIYLVSAVAFSDRVGQHRNVIQAAHAAGVRHVFYTSIQRVSDDHCPIEGVTASDLETEAMLKSSRLYYTIVRHPLYADVLPMYIGKDAPEKGFSAPAGLGRVALTNIGELAEGGATLLTQPGHENRAYLLNNGQTWSFADIAAALSRVTAKAIHYQPISIATFIATREAEGWPPHVASFIGEWYGAIERGAFDQTSRTLEELLGRKPKDLDTIVREAFKL